MALYLDSSAIVKMVRSEAESDLLRAYLTDVPQQASCALAWAEVVRAVGPFGGEAIRRARFFLGSLLLVAVDESLLHAAADLQPSALRSLDAIHLAAAHSLGDALEAVVTYDKRMADAARALGMAVESPGVSG